MIDIKRVNKIDDKLVESFKSLIPQLTGKEQFPSKDDLKNIVNCDSTHLLVAVENEVVIGVLTLVLYRIPTGLKGIIEDVVVDKNARGKGVATLLINKAIDAARNSGAYKLELTSKPARIEANIMYKKMGFELRETNFYRLDL